MFLAIDNRAGFKGVGEAWHALSPAERAVRESVRPELLLELHRGVDDTELLAFR